MSFRASGALGIECLEMRAMLSAVVIDRSSDPSADTIAVSTSGADTLVSVNGTNVYTGATSSITHFNITGTAYNDTISFDLTAGGATPSCDIYVDGGGGTNTVTAIADDQDMFLNPSQVEVFAFAPATGANIITTNVTNAVLSGPQSGSTFQAQVDGWAGSATINLGPCLTGAYLYALPGSQGNQFWAHASSSVFVGNGFYYTTDGLGYVEATGNGEADSAGIDDQGSAGDVGLGSVGGLIDGSDYQISVLSFGKINAQSYYSSDTAGIYGNTAYMHPTYSTANVEASGAGGNYTAALTVVGYTSVQAGGYAAYGGPLESVVMDDSGSSGTAYTHPISTTMSGPGYSNEAYGYPSVTVASYNGSDVADMDDNGATGASAFFAYPGYSYWQGNTSAGQYVTKEVGFKTVHSVSFNTADPAWLHDTVGGASMYGSSAPEIVYANGVSIGLNDFGGYANPHVSVYNTAPNGQYDTAQSSLGPYVVFYGNWTYV